MRRRMAQILRGWTAERPTERHRWHHGVPCEPLDIAAHHRYYWSEHWWKEGEHLRDILDVLEHVGVIAKDNPLPDVDVPVLGSALCDFKDHTAHGLDTGLQRLTTKLAAHK